MWLVPKGKGMPQHGPTEAIPYPQTDNISTKHIPSLLILL